MRYIFFLRHPASPRHDLIAFSGEIPVSLDGNIPVPGPVAAVEHTAQVVHCFALVDERELLVWQRSGKGESGKALPRPHFPRPALVRRRRRSAWAALF